MFAIPPVNYRERTVLMSILSGIGIAILPLAEFLSGQLYQVRTYKCNQNKPLRSQFMKQNADFQEGVSQA